MDIAEAEKTLFLKGDYGEAELKQAYHKMIAEYHPDKFASESDETKKIAAEKLQKIHEANKVLKPLVKNGARRTASSVQATSSSSSASHAKKFSTVSPKTYTYVPPKETKKQKVETVSTLKDTQPTAVNKGATASQSPTRTSGSTARKVYSDPVDVAEKPKATASQNSPKSKTAKPKKDKAKAQSPWKKRDKTSSTSAANGKKKLEKPKWLNATVVLVAIAAITLANALWGIPFLTRYMGVGNVVEGCNWTDVSVSNSGFCATRDGKTSIAVEIVNNNAEHALRYATVDVAVYGHDGQLLGLVDVRTEGTALPGHNAYGGTICDFAPVDVAHIECSVAEGSASFVETSTANDTYKAELAVGSWDIGSADKEGSQTVNLYVVNGNDTSFSSTEIQVVYLTEDNRPLFVWSGKGEGIEAGEQKTMSVVADMPADGAWATILVRLSVPR